MAVSSSATLLAETGDPREAGGDFSDAVVRLIEAQAAAAAARGRDPPARLAPPRGRAWPGAGRRMDVREGVPAARNHRSSAPGETASCRQSRRPAPARAPFSSICSSSVSTITAMSSSGAAAAARGRDPPARLAPPRGRAWPGAGRRMDVREGVPGSQPPIPGETASCRQSRRPAPARAPFSSICSGAVSTITAMSWSGTSRPSTARSSVGPARASRRPANNRAR